MRYLAVEAVVGMQFDSHARTVEWPLEAADAEPTFGNLGRVGHADHGPVIVCRTARAIGHQQPCSARLANHPPIRDDPHGPCLVVPAASQQGRQEGRIEKRHRPRRRVGKIQRDGALIVVHQLVDIQRTEAILRAIVAFVELENHGVSGRCDRHRANRNRKHQKTTRHGRSFRWEPELPHPYRRPGYECVMHS